jgi:hypothetical protein
MTFEHTAIAPWLVEFSASNLATSLDAPEQNPLPERLSRHREHLCMRRSA